MARAMVLVSPIQSICNCFIEQKIIYVYAMVFKHCKIVKIYKHCTVEPCVCAVLALVLVIL